MLDLRCWSAIRALALPQARNKSRADGAQARRSQRSRLPHARSSWVGSPVESERLEGVWSAQLPIFFAKRYGHRAVVLETIAAVAGMVGATLQHLKSLRRMRGDGG